MDQCKKEGLGGEARPSLLWVWAERRAGLEGSFTHRMMVTGVWSPWLGMRVCTGWKREACESSEAQVQFEASLSSV